MMSYYGYGDSFLGFHAIGFLLMAAFWVAVIYGIVLFARSLSGRPGRGDDRDRALEVLRERYAKGEVSKEEFEAKKKDLA